MVGEQRYSSWVLERTAIGETHRLRVGVNSVGRHSSSQIRISDSHYVSRHHAEVVVSSDNKTVTIKDLNSVNGVFVQDVLHKSATVQLKNHDHIGIGVAIEGSDDEDELTLPIYELKFLPITRGKQTAAPAQKSTDAESPVKIESDETPSTSSKRPAKSPAKQHKNEEIFIISDDDDDDDVPGGSGIKNVKIEANARNEKEINSTANIPISDISIKKEKIENEKSEQLPETNKKQMPNTEDKGKTLSEDTKDVEIPPSANGKENDKENSEKNSSMEIITGNIDTNGIEKNIHVPIISSIKKERIRSVSADVQNIFGDLDDDQKNKLKEISPLVYNNLSGMPLLPTTDVGNPLLNGSCITLLSDDEEPAEDGVELCVLIPKATAHIETAKSPNIFDTSLNYSTEDEHVKALEVIKSHLNEQTAKEKEIPVDNADVEDHTSYVPHSDDEDIEDFMFSQVFINDMKAELQDDFNKDFEEDLPQPDNPDNQIVIQIKQELDLEKNAALLNEIGNSCWVISDDEDYDEELETKVTDWSNKIFSQSFSCNNMSQVYELDDDISDSDEEDHNDIKTLNERDDRDDLHIVDHDIDNKADLYNSINDIDCIDIDDEQQTSNIALEPQEIFVENKDIHKDKPIGEVSKEKEQTFKGIGTSIKLLNDIDNTDSTICQSKAKGIKKNDDLHVTELSSSSAKEPKKEETLEVLKNLSCLNDIKEKSPDTAIEKLQTTDTESPLIRTRRKSTTNFKCVMLSSSSEDEFENEAIVKKPQPATPTEQQSNTTNQHQDNVPKTFIRPPPKIIDAPSLPKFKGKLRGVSAEKSTKPKHFSSVPQKRNAIIQQIRSELTTKDLKRKWNEKPSVARKRDKERVNIIKECRKDKLKKLAEKPNILAKDNLKRKKSTDVDEETKTKKPKVKLTTHNRGAFLAQDEVQPPAPKDNKSQKFKIPKVVIKNPEEKKKDPLQRSNSTDEIKRKEPLKRSASIDSGFTTFSQEISKPDQLLAKKPEPKSNYPPVKRPPPSNSYTDTTGTVCKEALAARALRTTNKITFASMEKNIIESEKNKSKLTTICNKRCNNKFDNITSILSPSRSGGVGGLGAKKKTVRFNDTPVIHYIERVCGSRKVAAKDILPLTTYKDRRHLIRRTYPIIDSTDKIISQILSWSDEWLIKRNADVDAASEIVYPMPTHFSSFDHYKSILFSLMKLEFVSVLERQYNSTSNTKKYKVDLEYVTTNVDRLMLVTKFNYQNRQQLDSSKYDLVILESKHMNTDMFAYLTSTRKGAGSCNTMVFEIIPKNITKEFFSGIKELTVRPVLDNVRVEVGAFNAVYQLEATPLFQKILNPLELLQCRPPSRKKIVYRGYDALNDKQRQVLLNIYVRIIDETTPNVSLLQGPPGTGKSCVITNLALQTMYGDEVRCMDKKILICAHSNTAIDVIASKLYDISMKMRPERRFRLIRYGIPDKISPSVYPVTLQHIIEQEEMKKLKSSHPDISLENKENLKSQMLQLEAQIADMSKRNIKGTVEEDILLEKERQLKLMRNISNQFTRPEDERSIVTWYLNNANIVCATLSGCVKLSQYVNYFDICIIDEATQCTEPLTLLPLMFAINSMVLVGDTQQLPATILSKKANELGLGKSMFTRIQNCLDNVPCSTVAANSSTITPNYIICGLQTQYRMNPEICRWPNQYFYRNELINGQITINYKTPLMPFSVLNLAYTQNEFCTNGKITNNLEAEFVAKLLKALDGFIPNKYNSYGVITPYAHHRTTLENSIRSLGLTDIMVNTIESYQGLEKDVIVISNARTNGVGFLANPQRLNVALTRPKKCLILCGNFKNLEIVPAWRCLLQSARERNLYHEISANCVKDIYTNVIDKIKVKK